MIQIKITLPPKLAKALRKEAQKHGISLSEVCRRRLDPTTASPQGANPCVITSRPS